jgi:flavin reductase (DIM6/NTAB) family NADH-FMN oxidoreductase RutF
VNENQHVVIHPKVLYVGTPVMLLCTENPDGSTNISPASSYWALGQMLTLGLLADGQAVANLKQRPELTVNFPSPEIWRAVEAIADTTGVTPVPGAKLHRYVHESDKFGRASLTPQVSDLVIPPRIQECSLQFEAMVRRATPGLGDYYMVEAEVLRVHALPGIVSPGTNHVDPRAWQPTIYSFRHYFGIGAEHGFRPTSDTAGSFSAVPAG